MDEFTLDSVWKYEDFVSKVELNVQRLLEEYNYDTLYNLLVMHEGYKRSQCSTFIDYFHCYMPRITANHHTCVGLALELWTKLYKLNADYPTLTDHLFLASCEESLESLDDYVTVDNWHELVRMADSLEKEHVVLALRLEIEGRPGVMLCDPGYHVGRVITVMHDGLYPHTGWFVQSDDKSGKKEYNYQMLAPNYNFVEWTSRTTRNGVVDVSTGLIYTMRPYFSAIDVTERRNLVYNYRSLLARDLKGHLVAGVYFKLRENSDEFTLFYTKHETHRQRLRFSMFEDLNKIDEDVMKAVTVCNEQLHLPDGSLLAMLRMMLDLWKNKRFVREMLEINKSINELDDDN